MKSKHKVFIGLAAGLVGMAVLWFFLLRKPTLEEHASRIMNAILDGDVALMMRYIDEDEKATCNITLGSLQNFVSGIVAPSIRGYKPDGAITIVHLEESNAVRARQKIKNSSGDELTILLTVHETDNGAVVSPLLRTLLYVSFFAQEPSAKTLAGAEKMRFLASKLREHRSTLENTGIVAIANPVPGKKGEYSSWDEFEAYLNLHSE